MGLEEFKVIFDLADGDYIKVPSLGLMVSRNRVYSNSHPEEARDFLHSENGKLLNIYEFKEFLKCLEESDVRDRRIYENLMNPHRADYSGEWLGGEFKWNEGECFYRYSVFDNDGNVLEKEEKLLNNTLMKPRSSGICVSSWFEDSNKQGFPKKSIDSGSVLGYYPPRKNLNNWAVFGSVGGNVALRLGDGSANQMYNMGFRVAKKI
jgi:hypothetical protein